MGLNGNDEEKQDAPSMRDQLSAAFDTVTSDAPEPVAVETGADDAPAKDDPEARPDDKLKLAAKVKPAVKQEAKADEPEPDAETPEEKPKVEEKPKPASRPPSSWKAAAREAWATVPDEARQEIARREKETVRALSRAAESEKLMQGWGQVLAPHMQSINAEGVTPAQAVDRLFRMSSALQYGTPGVKTQLVGEIIKRYGVPVDALASYLEGKGVPQGTQQAQPYQAQQFRDPRMDQFLNQVQQEKQAREQSIVESVNQELEEITPDMEFLDDVRDDMADLMELAAKRKINLSWEDAYKRACANNGEITAILDKRKAADEVKRKSEAAKKAAGVGKLSLKTTPGTAAGKGANAPGTTRETLSAAWDMHARAR